jgi:hypothetical protein
MSKPVCSLVYDLSLQTMQVIQGGLKTEVSLTPKTIHFIIFDSKVSDELILKLR